MIARRRALLAGTLIGFCLCASLAGALTALRPDLVVLGLVTAGVVIGVVLRPFLAVFAVLAVDALGLVLVLTRLDTGALNLATFGLVGLAAVSTRIRASTAFPRRALHFLVTVSLVLAVGVSVALVSAVPPNQVLAGFRLLATPLLCAVIALGMSKQQASSVLKVATILAVASAVASVVETRLGIGGLLDVGLTYGTNIRQYEGELRAPGLFTTNYALGAFAGVLGALAFVWWPVLGLSRWDRIWRWVAIAASSACLVLSIYRTGILVLLFSLALWIAISEEGRSAFGRRLLGGIAGAVAVAYVLSAGFGSAASLEDRTRVWSRVLAQYDLEILGHGLGFSGAASSSRFAIDRVTVDNYYLSLALQLGVFAAPLLFLMALSTLWMLRHARRVPILRAGIVLAACLVGFLFVDFWEYTAAMALALTSAGVAYGRYHAERSVECNPETPQLMPAGGLTASSDRARL